MLHHLSCTIQISHVNSHSVNLAYDTWFRAAIWLSRKAEMCISMGTLLVVTCEHGSMTVETLLLYCIKIAIPDLLMFSAAPCKPQFVFAGCWDVAAHCRISCTSTACFYSMFSTTVSSTWTGLILQAVKSGTERATTICITDWWRVLSSTQTTLLLACCASTSFH